MIRRILSEFFALIFKINATPSELAVKQEDNIPKIGPILSKNTLYTIEVIRKWELGDCSEANFGHCVYSFTLDSGKKTFAGIVELVEARDSLIKRNLYRKAVKSNTPAKVISLNDARERITLA